MSEPNGLERASAKRLAEKLGIAGPAEKLIAEAFAEYGEWLRKTWKDIQDRTRLR